MEIKLQFYNQDRLIEIISAFYVEHYKKFKKENPNGRYTRKQLRTNIRNAISINGTTATERDIRETTISNWKSNEWKEVKFLHWYFALKLIRKPNSEIVGAIMDALHESRHHNDIMQTSPYESQLRNRKTIITESQLRLIIRKTLRRVLLTA